ncbi:MAG: substrate-binding domain-containing protein [Bacillota bacterium]
MKKLLTLAIVFVFGIALIGCTQASTNDGSDSGNPFVGHEQDEYIMVLGLRNIEYFKAHQYMWEKLGEDFGVKTTIMGTQDMDVANVSAAIDQAAAKNPKGIVLWGFDDGLANSINQAIANGIPVIPIIGDVNSDRDTYIGSSQTELGHTGAQAMCDALGGESATGVVGILSLPGVAQFDQREEGFREGIEDLCPAVQVLEEAANTEADLAKAAAAASSMLSANSDLDGFFGTDSTAAFGALDAVRTADKIGDVLIVGMDRNSDILEAVKDEEIYATIAQNDVGSAYWALLALITENYYGVPLTSDNEEANVVTAPSLIYLQPNVVDSENVDYFLDQNEIY